MKSEFLFIFIEISIIVKYNIVTEYFVPPLSTAATRAHKQQQKRSVRSRGEQQLQQLPPNHQEAMLDDSSHSSDGDGGGDADWSGEG